MYRTGAAPGRRRRNGAGRPSGTRPSRRARQGNARPASRPLPRGPLDGRSHHEFLGHRIDAEELHHAQHRRADAGEGGAHQRCNGHEAAALAPHDMTEELVVEQRAPAADKMFPPRDDIGRRGVTESAARSDGRAGPIRRLCRQALPGPSAARPSAAGSLQNS